MKSHDKAKETVEMPIEAAEKAVANPGKPTACRPTDP